MHCKTWDRLYEKYEHATLKRIAEFSSRKERFTLNASDLERLNTDIAKALRQLRDHELMHRCHS